MKHLLIVFFLILSPAAVIALDYQRFSNPEQQEAYESLTSELRCLVCQNQTIADSNAELAGDLRRQVYEMLQQGKTREEIIQFMTQRYGDFVLYKPPFKGKTSLLWIAPVVFLLIGLITVGLLIQRKKTAALLYSQAARGDEETEKRAKIRSLLEQGDES
jgi:cytochrome c-type biogenesis protein CcmH